MVSSSKKKKTPAILFFGALFAIVIMMFVSNYRNTLEQELDTPVEGIKKLYTTKDSLVAVSDSSEVRIWNWDKIDAKPEIKRLQADTAVWLSADKLAWVPSNNPGEIVVGSWADKQKSEQLTFGSSWQFKHLGISHTGKFVALLLAVREGIDESSGNYGRFRVKMFSPDFDKLVNIVTIDARNQALSLYELAVSEDGAFIASVGQKNKFAWIVAVDVAQKEILWEQTIQESEYFTDVAFSPNGKVVYAGGEGKHLYGFETISGKVVRQLLMEEVSDISKTRSFNKQRVTCAEVSPDGHIVAAGVSPSNRIYFWDTMTGTPLDIMDGCYGLNNLAFSPDSSSFVMAGRLYSGSLKVRQVPGESVR
jgi:WD40 repeat protein